MKTQEEIMKACNHEGGNASWLGDGTPVKVCGACWNLGCAARIAAQKAALAGRKVEGAKFWAERGIKIGQRVARSVAGFSGGMQITGIAKVGTSGAYVSSQYQPGKLAPEGWVAA